jgi:hypothetical protein
MDNSSSSISYEGFARGVGGKWGAFTSSRLASPKDRIRRTSQRTTPRDLSSSNIGDYSEFERNVGEKGVCSSALKESEVSAPSSISYTGFAKGVGGKWGAFTSSRLASPKDCHKRRTPQRTTPARDLSSFQIEDYSEFEKGLGEKGVCSSALKENEVEVSRPPPRKVKRLELNFSGDEEDSVSDLFFIESELIIIH